MEKLIRKQPGKYSRRSKYLQRRRNFLRQTAEWVKLHPAKVLGVLCGIILIYLTILFIQFNNEQKKQYRTYQSLPKK